MKTRVVVGAAVVCGFCPACTTDRISADPGGRTAIGNALHQTRCRAAEHLRRPITSLKWGTANQAYSCERYRRFGGLDEADTPNHVGRDRTYI
jgi:hypothetical protein